MAEHPKDRRVDYSKLVSLRFTKHHAGFCPGEVGGLMLADACSAIAAGQAELNPKAENYEESEEAILDLLAGKKGMTVKKNKQQKTEENTQTDSGDEATEAKPKLRSRRRTKG
ncbi:hypothetical protein LCGC14_2104540 [marine sediment metagenome]|uniref:Uncharacterized protein n=1 Tax=marine sediment metagenome TaxID=412755 RepID=A0A0F9GM40_9ZZZZ